MIEIDENGMMENARIFLYNYYSDKILWKKDSKEKEKLAKIKRELWTNEDAFIKELDDWESFFRICKNAAIKKKEEKEKER